MNTRHTILAILLAAVALAGCAASTAAPHVRFTIGPDTTLIDGPLNPDGTINYVAAINKIIGEGVTSDNNAAIPLLSIETTTRPDPRSAATLRALRATPPAIRSQLQDFEFYLAGKSHFANPAAASVAEQEKNFELATRLEEAPWKAADHPDAADWLKQNGPGLEAVEKAVRLPRFFEPFASDASPPTALDGLPMPPMASYAAKNALRSRTMLRAGEGDFAGALADLETLRKLARLLDQEHLEIFHLLALADEYQVFLAYGTIANAVPPDPNSLNRIRRDLESLPPLRETDPARNRVETLFALDDMMRLIRGDVQSVLKLQAFLVSPAAPDIDPGDLPSVDWDIALREALRLASLPAPDPNLPYSEKIRFLAAQAAEAGPPPLSLFAPGPLNISALTDPRSSSARVEEFLKNRPGESRQAYSRRIGAWLVGWDPAAAKRFLALQERCRLARQMALVAISLAEYRAAHGAYPDSLQGLGQPVLDDPFSGQKIRYKARGASFTLWSVGLNERDDAAKDDDIVITTATAPAP